MEAYQIDTQLTDEQKCQIELGLKIVSEWKRSKAVINDHDSKNWVSDILQKKVSTAKMRHGETILTKLIATPSFGDIDFDAVRMISAMKSAGASFNDKNAQGLTPVTIAIQNGRKILLGGLMSEGAKISANNSCNNPINAGLCALQKVKLNRMASKYAEIYQRKDCEMMMAYLMDRATPTKITKSQIHAAWKLGYKDVSRALALYKKHPENRLAIVAELKKNICDSLVREFKRL